VGLRIGGEGEVPAFGDSSGGWVVEDLAFGGWEVVQAFGGSEEGRAFGGWAVDPAFEDLMGPGNSGEGQAFGGLEVPGTTYIVNSLES